MKGEETIDELRKHGLRIIQPRHGYRFSLDPLLLCDFAAIREGEEGVDLGAGCGVIPLILARSARGDPVDRRGVPWRPWRSWQTGMST